LIPDEERLSPRAESGLRAPWFEVSCCPTNVARTLASVASYVATATDEGVQLHQFADAEISTTIATGAVSVRVETGGYPFAGSVSLAVESEGVAEIAVRIPDWAREARVHFGGRAVAVVDGYARVRAQFASGDRIQVELGMEPRLTYPHPGIDALRGTVAVERGPLVLCAESTDLPGGADVARLRIAADVPLGATPEGAVAAVRIADVQDASWPYGERPGVSAEGTSSIPLIPYFQWANRGPSTMRVFLPLAD
jgi:DUF1680 family protein